jgi:hypothetical protein
VANSLSNDIVGKRNLLLSIDLDNSSVRAYPDEIARGGNSRTVNYIPFTKDRR